MLALTVAWAAACLAREQLAGSGTQGVPFLGVNSSGEAELAPAAARLSGIKTFARAAAPNDCAAPRTPSVANRAIRWMPVDSRLGRNMAPPLQKARGQVGPAAWRRCRSGFDPPASSFGTAASRGLGRPINERGQVLRWLRFVVPHAGTTLRSRKVSAGTPQVASPFLPLSTGESSCRTASQVRLSVLVSPSLC